MKKIVDVPFPLNLSEHEKSVYEPYLSYELAPVKIKKLKNVFVAFTGFCMNNGGLIKECHHDYPFQQTYYQNEVAKYYYDAIDHPENLVTLDDDNTYLAIHHPWFNYYHWICESIFRLWMVRHQLDKLTLIIPEHYKNADFIKGALEAFNIKSIYYIPYGKSLMVRNLCLPQIKPICDSYNARQVKQVSSFYKNYVLFERKIEVERIDRLYVSRQLAPRRKVINEQEILNILGKYRFTIFHPENHTFLEQIAIFSQVKYLVGEHGSGLTNLLFMNKKTSILELHKNKTNELDRPGFLFWYMAEALEINYYHQLCETQGKEDYFEGDYLVDADLFERNLIKMLK